MECRRVIPLLGLAAALSVSASQAAQNDTPQPPTRPKVETKERRTIERFCGNAVPSVEELRAAAQKRQLEALDHQVRERIELLKQLSKTTQEWIERREQLMNRASQNVVAIYAKSDPESAAKQLDEMQDGTAAAILSKLPPQRASAILGEMNPSKASKIIAEIRGDASTEEKKL